MNVMTAGYLVIFGVLMIFLGLVERLTHPEGAITAMVFGGTFGVLSILWGILGSKGVRWSRWAALVTTTLLTLVCGWRASARWQAVVEGEAVNAFGAFLITVAFAVSAALLFLLLKDWKHGGVQGAGGANP
jgi:hypothetical protein